MTITLSQMKRFIRLDRETGLLFWLPRTDQDFSMPNRSAGWNKIWADTEALGCIGKNGYKHGNLTRIRICAHRVVYSLFHDCDLVSHVDHIDGNKINNTPLNLRNVSKRENAMNMKMNANNTSGHMGVTWDKAKKAWMVRVGKVHIGRYSSLSEATAQRKIAEARFGYHPNHGRSA